jgi:hypothetical protein
LHIKSQSSKLPSSAEEGKAEAAKREPDKGEALMKAEAGVVLVNKIIRLIRREAQLVLESISNEKLHLLDIGVRNQDAAGMRISRDQKGYFLFKLAPIEQHHFLGSRSQKVTRLETQPEGRAGNLSDKAVALLKPLHVSVVDILRADEPVLFPCIISDQMFCEDVVPHGFEESDYSFGDFHGGSIACHRKTKIDFHGVILAKFGPTSTDATAG